jgi:hypothetical protein
VQHAPAWRDALIKEAARNKEQNMAHSHLYKTGGTVVGTFQRIDIPILRQFDQYNYVLFTGAIALQRLRMCDTLHCSGICEVCLLAMFCSCDR